MNNNKATKEPIYKPYLKLDDFLPECRPVLTDYTCNLCEGVMHDPVMETCGIIYCRSCINTFVLNKGVCPKGKNCDPSSFISVGFVIKVTGKQKVYCKNKQTGCDWIEMYSDLGKHLQVECKHQPVACKYDGCEVKLIKNNIEMHMTNCEFKKENCAHCEEMFRSLDLSEHIKICPRMKIECPLLCGEKFERKLIEDHTSKNCANAKIECPYKLLGCNYSAIRKEVNNHLQLGLDNHNFLMFDEMMLMKNKLTKFSENFEEKINRVLIQMDSKEMNMIAKSREDKKIEEKITKEKEKMINKKRVRTEEDRDLTNPSFTTLPRFGNIAVVNGKLKELEKDFVEIEKMKKIERDNLIYSMPKSTSYQEEITIDTLDISKGIIVNVNNAICSPTYPKSEHRFAMTNNILNDMKCEWKVIVKNITGKWLGIGVCLKELVVSNKFKFVGIKQNFVHGTFMISTNGYSWNSNNIEENDVIIKNFPQLRCGDEVGFKYDYETEELDIIIGNFKITLHDVCYPRGEYLVPFVLFINPGDEVSFSKLIKNS
jgi:hypothetical protein